MSCNTGVAHGSLGLRKNTHNKKAIPCAKNEPFFNVWREWNPMVQLSRGK